MNQKSKKVLIFAIFIWSLSILFFFFEFFLRVFLGTIATNIIQDLQITAQKFSIICASYYVIYALMQMPVGFLVDKFGVRKLLSLAAFVCSFGVIWFGFSHSFFTAAFSRMVIGFGSSFAFVSMLVIALNWFDKKYFGFLSGFAQLLGSVGPLLAGAPLAILLKKTNGDWRIIQLWLGLFGIILGLLIALFVRNKPKGEASKLIYLDIKNTFFEKMKIIFQNSQAWWIVIYSGLVYVGLPLLAAYWGTSFLESKGFAKTHASFIISILWLGYALGCPLIGKISDKIKRRKSFLIISSFLGTIVSFLLIFFSINNYFALVILSFLLGFSSTSSSLTFALMAENTPQKVHGSAMGLNNGIIMMFSAIIPSFSSMLIGHSLKTHGRVFAQIKHIDFISGLSLIPIAFFISLIIAIFFIKETYCRSQVEIHKIEQI